MKILELTSKPNTYNGQDWQGKTEDGKTFYSTIGNWNRDWKVGDEIVLQPNQIEQKTSKQGNSYYKLKAPPEARQFGGGNNPALLDGIKAILDLLKRIDDKQDQILKIVGFSEAPAEEIQDCPL
jgi:hypothetical protein